MLRWLFTPVIDAGDTFRQVLGDWIQEAHRLLRAVIADVRRRPLIALAIVTWTVTIALMTGFLS